MKSCVAYLTKKNRMALQLSLLRGSAQKNLSLPAPTMYSVLHISSKSVHFRSSYSRTRQHCQNVNLIFG